MSISRIPLLDDYTAPSLGRFYHNFIEIVTDIFQEGLLNTDFTYCSAGMGRTGLHDRTLAYRSYYIS